MPDIFEIFSTYSVFSKSYEKKTGNILTSLKTEDLTRCSQQLHGLIALISNSDLFEEIERGLEYELSDDGALYFSCLIFSQGEKSFQEVMKIPNRFWSFFGENDKWRDMDEIGEFILTSIDWELLQRKDNKSKA